MKKCLKIALAASLALTAGGSWLSAGSEEQQKAGAPKAPAAKPAAAGDPKAAAPPAPSRQPPSELQKAVQEFRLQTQQLLSGKSRIRSSGRQNTLSGRLFEYLRNDAMDAIPHEVNQRGGTKSLLRRNQFGLNVSGPILIPRLYDGRGSTFFSLSFESTRERIAHSYLFNLPTIQQQAGDFSDLVDSAGQPVTIYDPATTRANPAYNPNQDVSTENLQYLRDPFPNNRIPLERMDPVSLAALAYYTKPNVSVGPFLENNYWTNSPYENRASGIIAKVDHSLREKHQTTFNLNFSKGMRKSPQYFPGPGNPGQPPYNYYYRSGSIQHVYSVSPKTIWRFSASGGYNQTLSSTDGGTNYPELLGLKNAWSEQFPAIRFDTYLSLGPQIGKFWDNHTYYTFSTSLSTTLRAHTLSISGSETGHLLNTYRPSGAGGLIYFSKPMTALPGINNTGNSFASFLLGTVRRGDGTIVVHPTYHRKAFTVMSVTDEVRIKPGLIATASLGFNHATPQTEKHNRQSTVSLTEINPQNNMPGALIFDGKDRGGKPLQPGITRLEPSFTLSLNPWNDSKTVLRLRYELNYSAFRLYGGHFATQGFNATPVFISSNEQISPAFSLRNGFPTNYIPPPDLRREAANGTDADAIYTSDLVPVTQEWNLSIQRELPYAMVVRTRVSSWRGTHYYSDGLVYVNAVPVENLKYRDLLYDETFRNSLRPMPQFRRLEFGGGYPGGDARGSSMSVTLDKRLSAGLYGNATYRLSKQIDNTTAYSGAQDAGNLRAEMSITPGDVTHSVSFNYTYELPFGKGKSFLHDGGLLAALLGSWSLSGISTIQGGPPLSLRPLFNHTGGIIPSLRVNVVPGVDSRVDNPSPDGWFNPAAFSQPEDFTLGNASRTHPQLRGPGYQMHHLSLTRRVNLKNETALEILTEAFNFPNHANWNDPDTRIGPDSSPNLNAGKIIGSVGGRVMQCGLRFLF